MTDLHHDGFEDPKVALAFITAGKSTFTLVGAKTRYTYRVSASKDGQVYFVGLLTGPDNTTDYTYLGLIPKGSPDRLRQGSKGNGNHPAFKALDWTLKQLFHKSEMPSALRVVHASKCGRCGRALTVPESIDTGFGPECIKFLEN